MIESLHRSILLDRDVELRDVMPGIVPKQARVIDVAYNDRDRTWQLLVIDNATGGIEVWPAPIARVLPHDSQRRRAV